MNRIRNHLYGALALILSVNLALGYAWHDHGGHAPASHDDAALEVASHDHPGSFHAGHAHGRHAHGDGQCHVATGAPVPRPATLMTGPASPSPGWSSSNSGDEHPHDCAVCRFLGQSSAPAQAARLECSQPVVTTLENRTTSSPVSRLQRRQQSRAPPAVS